MPYHESIMQNVGDKAGEISTKALQFLSSKGLETSATTGKILSLGIIALGIAGITKLIHRPSKWFAILLLGIVAISIISSMTNL